MFYQSQTALPFAVDWAILIHPARAPLIARFHLADIILFRLSYLLIQLLHFLQEFERVSFDAPIGCKGTYFFWHMQIYWLVSATLMDTMIFSHKKVLLRSKHMTITGPYPNKRQRRGKDSTRYSRPTVRKSKEKCKKITFRGTHCLLWHYLCKNFYIWRNTKNTLTLSLQKKSLSEEHKKGFWYYLCKKITFRGTLKSFWYYLCKNFYIWRHTKVGFDIIFAKIFTIKGTLKLLWHYLCKKSLLEEHITDFWIIFVPSFIWKAVIDTQEWHKSDGRKH